MTAARSRVRPSTAVQRRAPPSWQSRGARKMTVKNRLPTRLTNSLQMIKTLRHIYHPKDAAKTSAFHSSPRPPLANQTALNSSETKELHRVKPSILWPKISFILVLALFAAIESETTGHVS